LVGKLAVIADVDTATLFKLAGVKNSYAVDSGEDAERVLSEVLQGEGFSIVVVTERLVQPLQAQIVRNIRKRKYPIVVTVPDRGGPIEEEVDPVFEVIKTTLGVELKIKKVKK